MTIIDLLKDKNEFATIDGIKSRIYFADGEWFVLEFDGTVSSIIASVDTE